MSGISDVDVLIVGGGIAGLAAAVAAKKNVPSAEVVLLDKCEAGKSGCSVQAKGLAAVGEWSFPCDSPDKHLEDTLSAGCYINNYHVAKLVTHNIARIVGEVERIGMLFDKKDPSHYAASSDTSAGHRHYRYVKLRDSTGKVLQDVLRREAYRRGVVILNGIFVTEILVQDGKTVGAIGFDSIGGQVLAFAARATVIATGGAGYLYQRTSNPPQATGDGIWLAYQAGAELMDMEMVQFYPVNYVYPKALEGKNVGSYEQAKLYDISGKRFMESYDPIYLENTTRDKLSQAIYMEIRKGNGTTHGGVYIDRTGLGEAYYAQFPVEVQTCLEGGLDIKTQRGEVSPAAHYTMGGIRINAECETSIQNLYAAGEVAAGVHGANRLANNSLSDTLVLGFTAGERAASIKQRFLQRNDVNAMRTAQAQNHQRLEALLAGKGGKQTVYEMKQGIRSVMWSNVGVIRAAAGLWEAIDHFQQTAQEFERSLQFSTRGLILGFELTEALEAQGMLGLGEIIARSALFRTESRGAHYRSDHPEQDDANWTKNVLVRRDGDEMRLAAEPSEAAVAKESR